MQKKSLLVALFCGALCLTGCLKNEESASVAQVRLAKAEELKSLAVLNEATAAAKLIYANAEKTVKEAEAKLIEAQAALVNAQAETEKVRADLLKVQIQLANVKVEEERVKLQMLEADLEARLAALAVEKAAADAAKQAWVNVLNDLVAQSKIDAINNTKNILDAEAQLEDYILTLAGQKADSAKYYAGLYFESLKEIEALQAEELEWKAIQVLVNQEAILTRDAIHEAIKANNEEIAENNALIAALKEQQSKTPEEAEAELLAARKALEEAYTKYQDALKSEKAAKNDLDELNGKKADFVQGWNSWAWDVQAKMAPAAYIQKNLLVEVGETTVTVPTVGINVKTDAGVEFVPFFNDEATKVVASRYPNVTVYDKNDHIHLKSTVIAPASIEFDNIKDALDASVARQETIAEKKIAARTALNEWVAGQFEEQIEALQEMQELHEQYVAVRQEAVTAAEDAYKQALADAKEAKEDEVSAWVDFQEYMLLTYPTLTSNLFIDRWTADTHYVARKAVEVEYAQKVQAVIDRDSVALKAAVKPLFEEYAEAKGDWKEIDNDIHGTEWKWQQSGFFPWQGSWVRVPTEANEAYNAWLESMNVWSPDFADATGDPEYDETLGWVKKVKDGETTKTIKAGTSQAAVLTAKFNLDRAEELEYAAKIDYLSGVINEFQYNMAKATTTRRQNELTTANKNQDNAWLDYVEKYNKISELIGIFVNEIEKNYNPRFEIFKYVVFPTDALYDPDGKVDYDVRDGALDTKGKWVFDAKDYKGEMPGEAQRALMNAVKKIYDFRKDLKAAQAAYAPKLEDAEEALAALNTANNALIKALGGKAGESIDKYLDETAESLYEAFLAAKEVEVDVEGAYENLWKAYRAYPDHIGAPTDHNHPYPETKNFGWLISNYELDYKATFVGRDGKDYLIALILNPGVINPFANSMQFQVEMAQNMIDEVLPAQLAAYEKAQNNIVKNFKNEVATILEKVDAYKSLESEYDTWVDNRNAADEAWNQAKMDSYDAKLVYVAAKAEYNAANAVVNEGTWVYDPKGKIDGRHQDGFVKVNIAKAIEYFEGENAELEAENEYYRNILTDGETVLATVNQILDEKIQTISDNIQILVAISAQYKAIMNAYLGVNEDEE